MSDRTTWQMVARRIRVPLGFAFAAVFLYLARPTPSSLAASVPLVLAGIVLRGYAAGYVKKNQELTTTGPYAYTRNPLYLGSMLLAFGFALASRSWLVVGALVALFAAIYWPTIRSEEMFLRERFVEFRSYAAEVPRLLPRLTPARRAPGRGARMFSTERYLHHREYNSAMGAGAIYALLLVRLLLLRHT